MSSDTNQEELSARFREDGDTLLLAVLHDGSPSGGFLHVWSLLPPAPQKPEELVKNADFSFTQIR